MESGLQYSIILSRLWFSAWESGLTVLLSVTLGGGLAWLEHAWRVRPSRWFTGLMILPVFLPSAVVALGFIAVWGNAGYVNDLMTRFGSDEPIRFLYSPAAIIAAHCFYNIPLAYLAVRLRLTTHHYHLEEAARVAGASAGHVWRTVTWPRVRQSVYGVSVLIFLYSFMSFAIPLILGGIRYQTMEVYIYTLVTQQFDFSKALMVAGIQFAVLIVAVYVVWHNRPNIPEQKIADSHYAAGSTTATIFIKGLRLMFSLYVMLPIGAVLVRGSQFTLFRQLLAGQFATTVLFTLLLATVATAISLGISWRLMTWLSARATRLPFLILVVSPITLGLLLRLALGQHVLSLLLAYCIMLIPVMYYLLKTQWQTRPLYLIDTLRVLGANARQRLRATLRWMAPALGRGLAFGYAFVLGDIAMAAVLAPVRYPTAMQYSYGLVSGYRFATAAAGMSLVLITIGLLVGGLVLLQRLYDPRRA